MRREALRGILVAVAAGVCLPVPCWAQNREKAWELQPYVGYVQFYKQAGLENSPSYGLSFAYHFTKRHEIEFGYAGTSTKFKEPNRSISADLTSGHVNYIYNIFLQRRGKAVAFLTAGLGVLGYSAFGFTTASNSNLIGDVQRKLLNFGTGIRFFGSRRAGVRIDTRWVFYCNNDDCGQRYFEASAGLTMVLGGS